jgi:DNA invertase Pin-like site-specific DNA recombinase
MAIIGYARVSTAGQSLDVQLSELSSCTKVFQEKESGAKATRERLALMLEFVRDGDTVMVTKLCRLARNTRHLLELVELLDQKQVALKVLNLGIDTSTSTGRLMLTMIGAVAAFEREILLERQAEGIAAAKRKGKYLGRKPTAMAKAGEVKAMVLEGVKKVDISMR